MRKRDLGKDERRRPRSLSLLALFIKGKAKSAACYHRERKEIKGLEKKKRQPPSSQTKKKTKPLNPGIRKGRKKKGRLPTLKWRNILSPSQLGGEGKGKKECPETKEKEEKAAFHRRNSNAPRNSRCPALFNIPPSEEE